MLLSLTAIALVAAAALASLNAVTKAPIEAAQKAKVENAISAVLPPFATLEDRDVDGNVCHVATGEDGSFVGAAVEASDGNAFGGLLRVMVGFDNEGNITGYQILETHETPGLERFGLRMYRTAPSITVEAVSDTRISSAYGRLYEI